MKTKVYLLSHVLPVCLGCLMISACSESSTKTSWYKGNLHAHSYWSDGDDYPEIIMKWYKDEGYNFAVLSEHDRFARGERWIEPKKGTAHDTTFQNYLRGFGEEWVDFEEYDDRYRVRLKTLEEYRPLFEENSEFLIIQSEEVTDNHNENPVHLNAANIRELAEPQGGKTVSETIQNNIDVVLKQREETGIPMFTHLNHPNFGWAVTAEDYKELENARFFEVYNGHPQVNNSGDAARPGTEEIWDDVNTHFASEGKPLLYGVAVDDAHNYHEFNKSRANPGRGWIRVKSQTLHPDSLVLAMERGDFYASSGVELQDIQYDGKTLAICINPEEGVNYNIKFIGTKSGTPETTGVLLDEAEGKSAAYTFSGDELFVRAKITSDKPKKNATAEGEQESAWVQPVVPE